MVINGHLSAIAKNWRCSINGLLESSRLDLTPFTRNGWLRKKTKHTIKSLRAALFANNAFKPLNMEISVNGTEPWWLSGRERYTIISVILVTPRSRV